MKKHKIVFIGNPLSGDDGVGPFLYKELKKESAFNEYNLIEAGTIGINLISLIEDSEKVIIIDAVHSKHEVGKVVVIDSKSIKSNKNPVSPHDFGVEQTIALIKNLHPQIDITIIGISIKEPKAFCNELSKELKAKIPEIKKEIKRLILRG